MGGNINDPTDFQSGGTSYPFIGTPPPVTGEEPLVETSGTGVSGVSSLSESDLEAELELIWADSPTLPKPTAAMLGVTTAATLILKFAKASHEAMEFILDNMQKSVEELKKRRKEHMESPEYQAWLEQQSPGYVAKLESGAADGTEMAVMSSPQYQAYLASLSPAQRAEQTDLDNSLKAVSGTNNAVKALDTSGLAVYLNPATIAVGATFTGEIFGASQVPNVIEPTVQQFNTMVQQVATTLPTDVNVAALGLIGGLFTTQLQFFTWANLDAEGAGAKGALVKGSDFAKKMARNTLSLVNDPGFSAKLEKAFGNDGAAIYKMLMLSRAMARVYKKEIGDWKVSAQEFKDMLNGKMKLPEGDVRKDLAAAIAQLQLPPEVKNTIANNLGAYFEQNKNWDTEDNIEQAMKAVQAYLKEAARGDLKG